MHQNDYNEYEHVECCDIAAFVETRGFSNIDIDIIDTCWFQFMNTLLLPCRVLQCHCVYSVIFCARDCLRMLTVHQYHKCVYSFKSVLDLLNY